MPSDAAEVNLTPSRLLDDVVPQQTDSNRSNELEEKKNHLTNCVLEEQVNRDCQRKLHRRTVFWFLIPVCFSFYGAFLYAVWTIYSDLSRLPNIPVAWVFPIISLVTVPTILLVIMTLCLYREKNNVSPGSLVRIAENAISSST